jgi:hypothetical protein
MLEDQVYTPEEVADHFKVPVDAINNEISSGRLRAKKIGNYVRVFESDLVAYRVGANGSAQTAKNSGQSEETKLKHAPDFHHRWPDGKNEKFSGVHEGVVTLDGRNYHAKVGFTTRESAGKTRRRALVLIDRYPTVEFVSAGTDDRGMMASIVKDRSGKQLPVGVPVPPEYAYANLRVGPYQDVVVGPGASNGLGVICSPDDLATMVRHAVIRYQYREERKDR